MTPPKLSFSISAMHTRLPSNSSRKRSRRIAIAALSGRALAAAARRVGDACVVFDLYADLDTQKLAASCVPISRGPYGFDRTALLDAVARLRPIDGLVYGTGFERDTLLLAELASLVPLIGNPPEVVAALKDPLRFSALLTRLGVPHPETTLDPPAGGEWLRKVIGGAGGGHISPAVPGPVESGVYFQRRLSGRPASALFVADGRRASVVGYTEQWVDATSGAPFRYGGCTGPARLTPALAAEIAEASDAIAGAVNLVGLNGLDLLIENGKFHVLEVNPRPGATLDIFDGHPLSLWCLHCRAVAGRLPALRASPVAVRTLPRAAAILYAPQRLTIPADLSWPSWTADRGCAGTVVSKGEPICTVRASASTVAAARANVAHRAKRLLARLVEHRRP